jgi:Protein of unknown function (DUF3352)
MPTVRSYVVSLLGAVAALAFLAGCGGSDTGSTTDSAAMAPKDAGLYLSVDTNREGDQWQSLEALFERIPGGREGFDRLLAELTEDSGVDFEDDLLPALGDEVVVVLPGGSANPVGLAQPDDEEKLKELAERSDADVVFRDVEGWTAIAESGAALDAYERALERGRLADESAFSETMADLPAETLVRAYVRGEGLEGVLGRAQAGALGSLGPLGSLAQGGTPSAATLGTIALGVAAEKEGLRVEGSVRQEGVPASFSPRLLPKVPDGAFLVVTGKGGAALSEQLRKAIAGNDEVLRQFEQLSGVSLDDLLELFEGEVVFYARSGLPIPELTLVVEATGSQLETIDALFQRLAAQSNTQIASTVEGGVPVKVLSVAGGLSVRYAKTGGLVVVTTSPAGIRALTSGGAKLVDDEAFKAAADDVGYDGSTSGLVYVDVDAVAPLLQGVVGLVGGGTPGAAAGLDQLARALESLDSIAANVSTEGDGARFEAFVRVR